MDDLGRAILKERQWNFLLEVGSGANGLETELRAINGIDEIEKRGSWLVSPLHQRRSSRSCIVAGAKEHCRSCNFVLKTRP